MSYTCHWDAASRCWEWYRFYTYFISSLRSIKYASGSPIRLEWWTCTVNMNRSALWNRLSAARTSLAVRSGRAIMASCTSSQFYTESCPITSKLSPASSIADSLNSLIDVKYLDDCEVSRSWPHFNELVTQPLWLLRIKYFPCQVFIV